MFLARILQNFVGLATVGIFTPIFSTVLALLTVTLRKFKLGSLYLKAEQCKNAIQVVYNFPVQHFYFASQEGYRHVWDDKFEFELK